MQAIYVLVSILMDIPEKVQRASLAQYAEGLQFAPTLLYKFTRSQEKKKKSEV